MGLDTYAARSPDSGLTDEDRQAFESANIHLCGGLLSGDAGSFRGKIYERLILHVTGISLYQTWIPPEKVQEMYEALERCNAEQVSQELQGEEWRPGRSSADIDELRKFFKLCVERNLGLVGWW